MFIILLEKMKNLSKLRRNSSIFNLGQERPQRWLARAEVALGSTLACVYVLRR